MPDELPFNDPRKIWQDQPKEKTQMSINEIHRRVQRLQRSGRFGAIAGIVLGVAMSVVFAITCSKVQYAVTRTGWATLSVWCLYFAFQAYKLTWPGSLSPDANWSTSVEFYRSELERKRDYMQHIWIRSGLWLCFLGLALIVVPPMVLFIRTPRLLLNAVPLFALLAIWLVSFFFLRKREQEKLQREIDELERLRIDPESRI
ncbi:MAG: hypothetical protein ACLPWF_05035 [Bryobacteraceae bacterium]